MPALRLYFTQQRKLFPFFLLIFNDSNLMTVVLALVFIKRTWLIQLEISVIFMALEGLSREPSSSCYCARLFSDPLIQNINKHRPSGLSDLYSHLHFPHDLRKKNHVNYAVAELFLQSGTGGISH